MSTTFIYDCENCGTHDELGPAGGVLSCACKEPSSSVLWVTKAVDGEPMWRKTAAELEGRA